VSDSDGAPNRIETERVAWASMRAFVAAHEHSGNLREKLGLGLGVGRVKALLLLKDGALSLSELAAAHLTDAPYATVIVDRLETLGYVERTVDPRDHRRKLVALTPTGRSAAALAETTLAEPPPALAALDLHELQTLAALLSRLFPSAD
jgi:DNA-binding MarR family transcriptional regulator